MNADQLAPTMQLVIIPPPNILTRIFVSISRTRAALAHSQGALQGRAGWTAQGMGGEG